MIDAAVSLSRLRLVHVWSRRGSRDFLASSKDLGQRSLAAAGRPKRRGDPRLDRDTGRGDDTGRRSKSKALRIFQYLDETHRGTKPEDGNSQLTCHALFMEFPVRSSSARSAGRQVYSNRSQAARKLPIQQTAQCGRTRFRKGLMALTEATPIGSHEPGRALVLTGRGMLGRSFRQRGTPGAGAAVQHFWAFGWSTRAGHDPRAGRSPRFRSKVFGK